MPTWSAQLFTEFILKLACAATVIDMVHSCACVAPRGHASLCPPYLLTALVTVEDPDAFNEPLSMKQRWFKVDAPMQETVCAENNDDFFHQNLYPLPTATKPDF